MYVFAGVQSPEPTMSAKNDQSVFSIEEPVEPQKAAVQASNCSSPYTDPDDDGGDGE